MVLVTRLGVAKGLLPQDGNIHNNLGYLSVEMKLYQ